jgi:RNA polymerase sigma-70 factor, ECF subfamily
MQTATEGFNDTHVIGCILGGDVNAFELLVGKYQSHVFSIVRKHVPAEQVHEIAHDVFVRAYQGLASFSGKSGFKQWLSGIAVRTCYDFWRSRYRRREVPMSELTDAHREWIENTISDVSENAHERLGRQREACETLEAALTGLSAAERMVIELVYLEGCSHKEAAELLGWSVANIKVRAFRARAKLHKILFEGKKHDQGENEIF